MVFTVHGTSKDTMTQCEKTKQTKNLGTPILFSVLIQWTAKFQQKLLHSSV